MCIIVDTNCFASVFKSNSEKHEDFKPVLDWILKGSGKIVFGGSKYKNELQKAKSYLHIFSLLNKYNRIIKIDDKEVDQEQERIQSLITDPDFDDPHLPAMVIVSSCRLICSEDTRSIRFVKNKDIYPKGQILPKYYSGKRNKSLLCSNNIPDEYKPISKCLKQNATNLYNYIDSSQ